MTPQQVLHKFFGYDTFREHQREVIEQVLAGGDAFVLMPTGSGKSLCFQIPSIIRKGVGLVVSPLIALMQDQVAGLRQNGVRADLLNSSLAPDAAEAVAARVLAGGTDLLYVAPERLLSERFQRFLTGVRIALFAIDEAHCVSQWGHDFRPEYLQIATVTRQFAGVPRIALTASADAATRRDILEKLEITRAAQFLSSFDRPNICYRVQLKENGRQQVLRFIQAEHPADTGIVYCRSRKRVDEMAAWLAAKGINAVAYHAGLGPGERTIRQQRFAREEAIVVVATIAFGLGIDRPDVRFVVHFDVPTSMEAYYQETGRAGRDGAPSDAWMLYSLADVVAVRQMLGRSEGEERFKLLQQRKLEAVLGYCETTACRRQVLLRYFGESRNEPCGNCGTCREAAETWDGTVAAQKALSAVYRTGQRFGAAYLVEVLLGKDNERIRRFGHHRIKTFGVGQELSAQEWRSVFRQLMAAGYLTVEMSERAGYRLAEKSRAVLKGEAEIRFRRDKKPPTAARPRGDKAAVGAATLEGPAAQLWEALRRLRLEIAQELELPAYVIFHDKTLREMAVSRPASREALLAISGVGESKADRYGERFLAAIQGFKVPAD
ncbi:MAG: DNA helicase RecQ [Desulfobacterales bacterium]|nr:DNA helicase RecQ [Desulfobacterales bacterium]